MPPVSVKDVVKAIEGCGAFLHRRTGEIVSGDLELIDDDKGLPAWRKLEAAKLRAAAASQDWLLLPDDLRCETKAMIERFCKTRPARSARRKLLNHLARDVSVGLLKAKLAEHELYDDWEAFRRERIAELAAAWLTEQGIAFER
jgi:hypothetical protein